MTKFCSQVDELRVRFEDEFCFELAKSEQNVGRWALLVDGGSVVPEVCETAHVAYDRGLASGKPFFVGQVHTEDFVAIDATILPATRM